MKVWARVRNTNGCFSVAELTLVLATQIPNTFKRTYTECDDFLDGNGNNNSNNDKEMESVFLTLVVLNCYKGFIASWKLYCNFYHRWCLAEINIITNISNYRNIGYQTHKEIWVELIVMLIMHVMVRTYVSLTVEKLPFANIVTIPRQCDDNQDGISLLTRQILNPHY
jgi:hypothetical protein